jgi:tape measure domain-containing protein
MAIGKLLLKLGIDTTNLDKELGKVEKSMTKFGQNMSNLGSTLTQSLTLPIIGVGAAALKSFADMEKLQNGLIAIMGSSEGAAIELEKLRKVAENPGLALPEVVKASASLQSVGMNADAARETITQFGNAVARAGGGAEQFDGVVLALSQISAVGKVTQEDLNQIKERLPEFARVMKEEFGVVTAEGIRALGISSEEFIKRSVGALGNLERANGGLANTFDNLKDNVGASLAELGKAINETLNLEAVVATFSAGLQRLVDGFKSLNPETQGFIVKAGLIIAAIGPAIFIVGKLISTFGALVGTIKLIRTTILFMTTGVQAAFASLLANPVILGIVAAIAAIGAIALYVYDNWKAFSDNFKNIWINIKNSVMQGVTYVLGKLDNLQKALGLDLFDLSGMTKYQEEQRVVAAEFKTIGETVDSLKGKFKSLFMASPGKATGGGATQDTGELVFGDGGTPTGGGTGGGKGVGGALNTPIDTVNLLPTLDLLPDKLESISAANERLKQTNEDVANSFNKIAPTAKSAYDSLGQGQQIIAASILSFGELAASGFESMKELAAAVRKSIADIIANFIRMYVAKALASVPLSPFMVAIAPAIAAAAGGVARSLIMKIGAPKLAEGGLATGPTMAMVGDNKNARVDPEVIAPLSKLKSMMGDMGMGGVLETRISGNDLIILLNRSQKGLSRIQ